MRPLTMMASIQGITLKKKPNTRSEMNMRATTAAIPMDNLTKITDQRKEERNATPSQQQIQIQPGEDRIKT